jgi:hypothetical protein
MRRLLRLPVVPSPAAATRLTVRGAVRAASHRPTAHLTPLSSSSPPLCSTPWRRLLFTASIPPVEEGKVDLTGGEDEEDDLDWTAADDAAVESQLESRVTAPTTTFAALHLATGDVF